MTEEIENLKIELEKREQVISEFKVQTQNFKTVGHLKAHLSELEKQVEDKNLEVLHLMKEIQNKNKQISTLKNQ